MLRLMCQASIGGHNHSFRARKQHKYCRACYKTQFGSNRPIDGRKKVIRPKRQKKEANTQTKKR